MSGERDLRCARRQRGRLGARASPELGTVLPFFAGVAVKSVTGSACRSIASHKSHADGPGEQASPELVSLLLQRVVTRSAADALEASAQRQAQGKREIDAECDRKMAELDEQIVAMKASNHHKVRAPRGPPFRVFAQREEGASGGPRGGLEVLI